MSVSLQAHWNTDILRELETTSLCAEDKMGSARLPMLFVLLTASFVNNCWLKTNSECKSLCDADLRNPDNSYVEAVVLDGDVADFGCLAGLPNIKVSIQIASISSIGRFLHMGFLHRMYTSCINKRSV
jgi:hypothetical protein